MTELQLINAIYKIGEKLGIDKNTLTIKIKEHNMPKVVQDLIVLLWIKRLDDKDTNFLREYYIELITKGYYAFE